MEDRKPLLELLDGGSAHVPFGSVIGRFPPEIRGEKPHGVAHSPWEVLEHLRIAQRDILDFTRDPDYDSPSWPEEYWPPASEPPDENSWNRSIEQFRQDLDEVKALAGNPDIDLAAEIPHGSGQTYLREVLLVADHNAYHLGELVILARLLGCWEKGD